MEGTKFKRFFDQIGFKSEARLEAIKAIIKVTKAQEDCMQVDGSISKELTEGSNKICFTDADREVKYIHNRPLYVTVIINGFEVKRAFIDNRASVNIMP